MTRSWSTADADRAQRLAVSGHGQNAAAFAVLRVEDDRAARRWLRRTIPSVTFGLRNTQATPAGAPVGELGIGFTYRGLQALGLNDDYMSQFRRMAAAFENGVTTRAAQRLGDSGASAAENWEKIWRPQEAHVILVIHGPSEDAVRNRLMQLRGTGLTGWNDATYASHLPPGPNGGRPLHFGFRDNLSMPKIVDTGFDAQRLQRHHAGELLLGYENDEGFNRWGDKKLEPHVRAFFRDGSFAAVRKIEQHVPAFESYVAAEARRQGWLPDYVKAKMCGRWPNGSVVLPGDSPLTVPAPRNLHAGFDFTADLAGTGCPFGAHIRRVNPRTDLIAPQRLRPLFRRGMAYGPAYDAAKADEPRGLMGLFFCASLDDQFEVVMSQWVEAAPMGPPGRGGAKDPLVGHHDVDDAAVGAAYLEVPQAGGPAAQLRGMTPFVTTRGTAYAFFPGRTALEKISELKARDIAVIKSFTGSLAKVRPGMAALKKSLRLRGERVLKYFSKTDSSGSDKAGSETSDSRPWRDQAPSDRYCDIVLEGGVTSGIIYAEAVSRLAEQYRLSSIGGSSIGAFAAALAAAAEFSRRNGSSAGFELMKGLPEKLAETKKKNGPTRLYRLFRPQRKTRELFAIFAATLNQTKWYCQVLRGTCEAIRQYPWSVILSVIIAFAGLYAPMAFGLKPLLAIEAAPASLSWPSLAIGITLGLLASVILATLVLLMRIVWQLSAKLVPNGLGLCRGWSKDDQLDVASDNLDLTGYMHVAIQAAAGRDPTITEETLTFADLAGAPGAATDWMGKDPDRIRTPSIDLQVYATNLSHSRPYRFPADDSDDMGRLFFKIEDLEPYFPRPVIEHLAAHSKPYTRRPYEPTSNDPDLRELPQADLPVIVAVRMAMSFPLLISAVPLRAVDYRRNTIRRCLMSDGGLCSNFPIHLFDAFVPRWPTFGIALLRRAKDDERNPVWLPKLHFQGRGDSWYAGLDFEVGIGLLTGFLGAIWSATWRWNDMTMMRMPGVRDRVVRIFLEKEEGGVNIKMSAAAIRKLRDFYGKKAADDFLQKFVHHDVGWKEHRWVRLNSILAALRPRLIGITDSIQWDRHAVPMPDAIALARRTAPLRETECSKAPPPPPLTFAQATQVADLIAAVSRLEHAVRAAGNHQPYRPLPRPNLRVRHPT